MSFNRREKILESLREQDTIMLKDLEKQFPEVSSMTLRRDLEFFEKIGEAVRIRGGARHIKSLGTQEDLYALRAVKNPIAKERIAHLAADYAETGRSIFIDSGSTGMSFARALTDINLSILTCAPNVAMEVSKRYKPNVTMIGGVINRNTLSVSGSQSIQFIQSLNFDIAFLVASAFSPENGFTCGNADECELKRAIAAKARRTILMVDSSKFGKSMPYTFANMTDVDILVTDIRPDETVLTLAKETNTKVVF
ncbi:MAG: DeoR/GlpR transcriptional regulator [Clostridia bacterium]|nr:DeoR/GlpR transcriptional regulator [Clostridia bacterium]MBR6549194.1 DeoR/GlpR transcriptional regulator [Clostridia bacterium]